jgi:hypothetical protein
MFSSLKNPITEKTLEGIQGSILYNYHKVTFLRSMQIEKSRSVKANRIQTTKAKTNQIIIIKNKTKPT